MYTICLGSSHEIISLLKEVRQKEQLTQKQVAKKAGLSDKTIYKFEANPDKVPSFATLSLWTRALGMTLSYGIETY